MATVLDSLSPGEYTLERLQEHLDCVPAGRIRFVPPPGQATEEHVLEVRDRYGVICELVDGVLVEKTMGSFESLLAMEIGRLLGNFVAERNLGVVLGADGLLRLASQIRAADVSFISWDRMPGRKLPAEPIYSLAPDLAIEVLSPGNTEREMARKLREYFAAGTRLVWYIDPEQQTARAFTAVDAVTEIEPGGVLAGGEVLPGFELSLAEVFGRVGGGRAGESR